jgi:hypothetical protein
MKIFGVMPGQSSANLISSIINLVCPQCGGRMSEYQCEGRCRRNWFMEWNGRISPIEGLDWHAAGDSQPTQTTE